MTNWLVETSHMVDLPHTILARSLTDLQSLLQQYAETYRPREKKPPLGELSYRYELDELNQVEAVHVYFTNRNGNKQRFARLRKHSDAPS